MKIKLLFLLFCISLISKAENDPINLVLMGKDGTKVAYALTDKPKIIFTETYLVVIVKGFEVNYSLDNMAYFTYEKSDNTAITNLKTDESPFVIDTESLLFPALRANSTVTIYTINGTLVFKKTVPHSGEFAFPVSNLNAGVYMVNVNGLTYKIVKK